MFFRIYLFIFFLVCLGFFLYRDVFLFTREKGTHPFSILRSRKFGRATLMEIIIGCAYTILALVVIGYVFNLGFMAQLGGAPLLERAWIKWLGIADSLVFALLFFASIKQMGSSFSVGLEEDLKPELVTDGLFAYTRNPIFFAIIHMFLCVFLIIPNCLSLFLVFAYYLTVIELIKEEEQCLSSILGEEYQRYLKSVPRFFPRLWPLKKGCGDL